MSIFPNNFDWILERAACTPLKAFEKLRLQVQEDVNKRNSIRTENEISKYEFSYTADGGRFSVWVSGHLVGTVGVSFARTALGVGVLDTNDDSPILSSIVTLSNDGECKFKIDNVEYSFWQFRKMALENVFFTAVARWRP